MFKMIRAAKSAPHRTRSYSRYRRLIADLLHEGHRTKSIYFSFEADITDFMAWRAETAAGGGDVCSVSAYVAACFARTIGDAPEIQAQKTLFGRRLVIFEDVDLGVTVEKTIEDDVIAWAQVIRACNRKSPMEIHRLLKRLKSVDVEAGQPWRAACKIMALPRFARRLIWRMFRYSPFLKKQYLGTAGISSLGMFSDGRVAPFPISPMTITLCVGSTDRTPVYIDGELAARDILTCTITVDHEVIDGAPATRFIARFRDKIANPAAMLGLETQTQAP